MTESKTNREKYHYKCHKCEHEQSISNCHCSNCGIGLTADSDLVEGQIPKIDTEQKVHRLGVLVSHELMISCPECNAGWNWTPLDTYCFNCGKQVSDTDRVRAVRGLRDEVSALRKEVKALVLKEPIPVEPKPPWWWRIWGK